MEFTVLVSSSLLLVGSGVYYMMENYTEQVNLKEGYYNVLGIKLIFVVVAFLLSLYQTFGLRSKIAHLDLRPVQDGYPVRAHHRVGAGRLDTGR